MIETSLFSKLIEWIWLPVIGGLISVYQRLDGRLIRLATETDSRLDGMKSRIDEHRSDEDKRLTLLDQHYINIENKLTEYDNRRREDRQEIMDRIERHSVMIYSKIDRLGEKIDAINQPSRS